MSIAEKRLRSDSTREAGALEQAGELGEHGPVVRGQELRTGNTYAVRSPDDDSTRCSRRSCRPRRDRAGDRRGRRGLRNDAASALVAASRGARARGRRARGTQRGSGAHDRARGRQADQAAHAEAERAAFTFRVAAEEAKRIYGELLQLDWLPGKDGRVGHVRRVPLGPIAGITPFNFPLNLVAHKVAPALAAGNPIVVRPASQTPTRAQARADRARGRRPEEAIAVVPSIDGRRRAARRGRPLQAAHVHRQPRGRLVAEEPRREKRVTLELGGNAAVIVAADADARLRGRAHRLGRRPSTRGRPASRCSASTHDASLEGFEDELTRRFETLVTGDPLDEATDVGPLIGTGDAERVEEWLREAVDGGARILTGGERDGRSSSRR